ESDEQGRSDREDCERRPGQQDGRGKDAGFIGGWHHQVAQEGGKSGSGGIRHFFSFQAQGSGGSESADRRDDSDQGSPGGPIPSGKGTGLPDQVAPSQSLIKQEKGAAPVAPFCFPGISSIPLPPTKRRAQPPAREPLRSRSPFPPWV